jgi:hypothetical protein
LAGLPSGFSLLQFCLSIGVRPHRGGGCRPCPPSTIDQSLRASEARQPCRCGNLCGPAATCTLGECRSVQANEVWNDNFGRARSDRTRPSARQRARSLQRRFTSIAQASRGMGQRTVGRSRQQAAGGSARSLSPERSSELTTKLTAPPIAISTRRRIPACRSCGRRMQ